MRRILIERAGSKYLVRHGGDLQRDQLFESRILGSGKEDRLPEVDKALDELGVVDPESSELVKLRYFAGMTWEEIGVDTGIPDRTLRGQWTYAKAWLKERISHT